MYSGSTDRRRGAPRRASTCAVVLVALVLGAVACERERRDFDATPGEPVARVSALQPGPAVVHRTGPWPFEGNAYAASQGKALFGAMNCTGCHSHGGGGMGPALMDSEWIYGSAPEQIFASIAEGRPNGMPSWRGRLTDTQIWQLVAYVRSLSGMGRRDVRPARNDEMQVRSSEQNTQTPPPSDSARR